MRKTLTAILALASIAGSAQKTPADYVNPFIGTSNFGTTQPGPVMPGGMASMSPFNVIPRPEHKINTEGWVSTPFVWDNTWFIGFTQVNLSGVGCPDLGSLLLMPTTGELEVDFQKYASKLNDQTASPGFYSAGIDSYGVKAEMTATVRSTRSRYTFPGGESHVLLNIGQGLTTESGGYARIVSDSEIEGFRIMGDFCYGEPQSVIPIYFVVRVSKPAEKVRYWKKQPDFKGTLSQWSSTSGKYKVYEKFKGEIAGDDIGAAFTFSTEAGEQIEVSVGISYVSIDNARENLDKEQPAGTDFAAIRQNSFDAWNEALGIVSLEGGTDDRKTQFYTALYHNWIHPNVLNDVNGQYPEMDTKRVRTLPHGKQRLTMFSGWDVYRITPAFGSIFFPARQNEMARSMIDMYAESGNLPKFEIASNEFNVMEGDAALPYMTGCYFFGLTRGIDTETLYQAMLRNATAPTADNRVRRNQDFYKEHYYVPWRRQYDNSVSQAIELYVADWSLAQMARSLGRTADYDMLMARAMGYHKYFDRDMGLMRPVKADGTWMEGFNPTEGENFESANGFHEGSSWNYTFSIPYDIPGLIKLFGSPKRFADSLRSCFDNGYFDMGNEPDIGYPYYFSYVKGSEYLTQYYVNDCLDKYFGNKPGGLPGNDDAGTMSAWQNFSMMGIYPVTPSKPEYVISTPVFDRVTVKLDPDYYSKKELVIEAVNRKPENIYISKIELDGKPFKGYFISHDQLMNAGRLTIYCSDKPRK